MLSGAISSTDDIKHSLIYSPSEKGFILLPITWKIRMNNYIWLCCLFLEYIFVELVRLVLSNCSLAFRSPIASCFSSCFWSCCLFMLYDLKFESESYKLGIWPFILYWNKEIQIFPFSLIMSVLIFNSFFFFFLKCLACTKTKRLDSNSNKVKRKVAWYQRHELKKLETLRVIPTSVVNSVI